MAFDANNMFHDGTAITADITPTSVTRTGGSAVLDLKQTGAVGLAAVLVVGADITGTASDTLQVSIEECATVDGTYVEVARFPLLTKGTGMPGTYIRRFSAEKRYVRAKIDVTKAAAYSQAGVYIFAAPHPFKVL